jgi:arsenate reductase (thioredoxin)
MDTEKNPTLKTEIIKYFKLLDDVTDQIPEHKKNRLNDLALYINSKLKSKSWVNMVFVSPTDNSLSQLGQIWAKTISVYNNTHSLEAYSAGRNSKTINPIALDAISNYGFEIKKAKNGLNPVYTVKYADNLPAIKLFSKPLQHPDNPHHGYVALIINQNDQETSIPGAEFKIPLNYEIRPGENDEEKYERICRQISADMFFIFSHLEQAS